MKWLDNLIESISLLIAKSSSFKKRETIFWEAIGKRHFRILRWYADKGGDLNVQNHYGRTALFEAATRGDLVLTQELLILGADPYALSAREDMPDEETPLEGILYTYAENEFGLPIGKEYGEITALLMQNITDLSILDGTTNREHLIFGAVKFGHAETVKEMLARRVDPNVVDNRCRTPLWYAVAEGNFGIAEILLRYKANPNLADSDFLKSPLHIAAFKGDLSIFQLLLDAGASLTLRDYKGRSPLRSAEQGVAQVNRREFRGKRDGSWDIDVLEERRNRLIEIMKLLGYDEEEERKRLFNEA